MVYILRIKTSNKELQELYSKSKQNFDSDSGFDLYCPHELQIEPNTTSKIDFEIKCEMINREYKGHYTIDSESNVAYMLVPRSSLSKSPLRMSNSIGIIDSEYRGNIMAYVDHHKGFGTNKYDGAYIVNKNERLFQIVLPSLEPFYVEVVNSISKTERGEGGFGSTGQ
jgi:dUTP pyrophosphatase